MTANNFILQIVEFGLMIQFHTIPPMLHLTSGSFSPSRSLSVNSEISQLVSKTAVEDIAPSADQFVSPIFDVPKKDCDRRRVILNLKVLNDYITKTTFKLEGYDTIIRMLRRDDYFVSIDLQDAYLMFLIHPDFRKYFCFDWGSVRFRYRCMPFGLTSSPRIFTKVFKSVLVFLRGRGLRISAWFDDIILIASSVSLLLEHLHFTLLTLKSLGFLPHREKSMLTPSQSIYHLGFNWDSVAFTLSVPVDKVLALKALCDTALLGSVSLRFLNKILGTVESFRIAFPYAALHYRGVQKDVANYISSGFQWDETIVLSDPATADLFWWKHCPSVLPARPLDPFFPSLEVTTDSSESGWGGVSSLGAEAFGFWSDRDSSVHINVLETKAVFFTFRSLFRDFSDVSILIRCDNTTTVSYINHMGGVRSPAICDVIFQLYDFCIERNIIIRAAYLCGRLNTHADALSRRTRDHCYALPSHLFSSICDIIPFSPVIDLFASSNNNKLPVYFSEGPDPFASGFDAFVNTWPDRVYAFPPLHLVDNFIARFLQLNITYGLLICPFWPSQSYYPLLLELLIDDPFLISASVLVDHAMLPRSVSHFLVSSISSRPALHKEYLRKLPLACSGVSTIRHCVPTYVAGSRLHIGVLQGKLIIAHYL